MTKQEAFKDEIYALRAQAILAGGTMSLREAEDRIRAQRPELAEAADRELDVQILQAQEARRPREGAAIPPPLTTNRPPGQKEQPMETKKPSAKEQFEDAVQAERDKAARNGRPISQFDAVRNVQRRQPELVEAYDHEETERLAKARAARK